MEELEIKNAKITNVSLSMEDHGCLTFYITLDGGGWGCNYGGYCIGKGYLGAKEFYSTGAGLEVLMRIHHFYGISIDWLMGIGDIPYSDESITKAEEYANLNEALNFPHEIKKYVNHVYNDKDPSYYTIDNRFNLLFLRNFVVGNIVHGNEWDNPTIVERINSFLSLLKIPSEAEFQENWKFAVKLDENNKKIWKNPQVPIYNLSAYLSTHSK